MEFDIPKDQSSIIKVIGVGGGGGNAVNHMYNQGIKGVDFVVCNTDQQALDISPVPVKIQLGSSLTEGRGAGAIPEIGKNAAIENIEDIREILANNTKMVFITAGMGGGTGTGAAPVVAKVAKDMGILTVGIVTIPFTFEGRKRKQQAERGLEEMRKNVDTLLIIANDRLREMFGNLSLGNAFGQADNVLTTAAKGIAEVISVTGMVNVDFNDVSTVMKDSGVAIMGSATATGEDRAIQAVRSSLNSPLLNDNDIEGATYVLLYITYGSEEILMDEIGDITDFIQDEAGANADVIWGHGVDPSLEDGISVTVIATGFNTSPISGLEKEPEKKVVSLDNDEVPTMIAQPINTPVQSPTTSNNVWKEEEKEPYVKSAEEIAMDIAKSKESTWEGRSTEESQSEENTPSWNAPLNDSTPLDETSTSEWTDQPSAEVDQPNQDQWYNAEGTDEPKEMEASDESWNATENPSLEQAETPDVTADNNASQAEINWSFTSESAKEEEANTNADANAGQQEDKTTPKDGEVIRHYLTDEVEETSQMTGTTPKQVLSAEEQAAKAKERMQKIQSYTSKLKSSSGLSDLEQEPAYKRKNVNLDDVPHSSEENMSKFTLSEGEENGEKRTGLKENNSFLHDNVD